MPARSSFFTRSHLILPTFLALQLFASGTQGRPCNADDQDDFDCDDSDEDPATRNRKRIIAASVLGGSLLLIIVAYLIYVLRKRRTRAKQTPAYPFADMQGYANAQGGSYLHLVQAGGYHTPQGREFAKPAQGGGYASTQAPPPPGQPPRYHNGYGLPAPGQGF
ncbi:hypothetical protein C8F04DRAFT_664487 [Mycena alexandri]|uniref:Transmembrane protein n=1 Tax=Mycena alexandri TaxID=1745969 RepID=A0AAD6SQI3_9AGAR|nr:hypothetical protein C8F04DRAFT_664487 [Mycena alexandri]